jgi:hypothetical protein
VNPNEKIVGEKRDDSFSFFGYSDEVEPWKEDVEIFFAQMKLRLFFLMRLTVNHIPISSYVFFHAVAQESS